MWWEKDIKKMPVKWSGSDGMLEIEKMKRKNGGSEGKRKEAAIGKKRSRNRIQGKKKCQ